jgi:hypothetical protein
MPTSEGETHPRRPEARPSGGAGGRVFRIVVGTILVLAALKLAEPVLVPLVAGLFLAVLARPLQRRIARVMPRGLRWLGLVAAMLVVIGAVGAFAAALGLSGRAVARELRERRPRLEAALAETRTVAGRIGIPATAIPRCRAARVAARRATRRRWTVPDVHRAVARPPERRAVAVASAAPGAPPRRWSRGSASCCSRWPSAPSGCRRPRLHVGGSRARCRPVSIRRCWTPWTRRRARSAATPG